MRRSPPYARRTRHHPPPEGRVIVGRIGWELAKDMEDRDGFSHRFAVLPSDTPPADFDWSAFAGCEVRLSYYGDADRAQAAAAAVAMVEAGARMVLTIDHAGGNQMDRYRPMEGSPRA